MQILVYSWTKHNLVKMRLILDGKYGNRNLIEKRMITEATEHNVAVAEMVRLQTDLKYISRKPVDNILKATYAKKLGFGC